MDVRRQLASSFDSVVDEYEHGRVGYSPQALARLIDVLDITPGTRLLDLAAGSGKLTRLLVPTRATITAVEPLQAMSDRLVEHSPSVEVLSGTAQAIPLPDASRDVVVVGSAFHWFDPDAALTEIDRVLVRGGGVGLLWNPETESQGAWHDHLDELIDPFKSRARGWETSPWSAIFGRHRGFDQLQEEWFPWSVETSVEQYVSRIASISSVASLPPQEREQILGRVRRQLEANLAAAELETFVVDYHTRLLWSRTLG